MADEVQVTTDVKPVVETSTTNAPVVETKTPTVEKTGVTTPENKIPQARFNEVIEQKNAQKDRADQLEARLRMLEQNRVEAKPQATLAELEAQRLANRLGTKPEQAAEIIQTYQNLRAAELAQERVQSQKEAAKSWASQKAKDDQDYNGLQPELEKSFSSLTPDMQSFVAGSAEALEMFYGSVKARNMGAKVKDAVQKASDEAYKTKQAKEAGSSGVGGSSSGGQTGLENWRNFSNAEYTKRLPEINEALRKGTLK